jgi:hypothetical protein
MAIPIAVKVAVTVVTNPKLLKIGGGIILGVIIAIIAPIAILLGVLDAGTQLDWDSPEMQQAIVDNMPDTPGLGVWHDGHVGIYVGNGEVIEAMGTQSGVVKTTLPSARWTAWFKIPWLDYTAPATPIPTP